MAPLLLELSSLETESVEIAVKAPPSERGDSLTTLSTAQGNPEVLTVLTGKGTFPANTAACCCCLICCCECCCCCV